MLLLPLVLAGCATIAGDPAAVARAALDDLLGAITEGTGSLSRLEGTLSGGGYSVPFTLEISRDGTRHVNVSAGGFVIDVYCKGTTTVRIVDGVPYAARGGCLLDTSRFGSPRGSIDELNVSETRRDGVFLVATFTGPSIPEDEADELGFGSTGSVTLRIDGRGNARQITMTAPGESGLNATASHEPRKRWTLPETDKKLAAAIEGDTDFDEGRFEWQVDDAYDVVSLSEIEVRVDRASTGAEVARFSPTRGEQNVSGLLFRFVDGDEDGMLSERDSFTIESVEWRSRGDFTVVVWDTWADAPLAGRRIPVPSFPFLALAIALAIALQRGVSRQRG